MSCASGFSPHRIKVVNTNFGPGSTPEAIIEDSPYKITKTGSTLEITACIKNCSDGSIPLKPRANYIFNLSKPDPFPFTCHNPNKNINEIKKEQILLYKVANNNWSTKNGDNVNVSPSSTNTNPYLVAKDKCPTGIINNISSTNDNFLFTCETNLQNLQNRYEFAPQYIIQK